jgi:hypothetical protein
MDTNKHECFSFVIPAKAGIQRLGQELAERLDARLRGHDVFLFASIRG